MTMQDAADYDPRCLLCGHEHVLMTCHDCQLVDGPCATDDPHPGEDTGYPEEDLPP